MRFIIRNMGIMILCILSIANNVNARQAVITPKEISVITNPSETRDKRVLLFFELPKEISDSKMVVDFALLICEAGVNNALAGQIDIFPITTEWKNKSVISWDDPWDKSGGDYSEEYLANNYTLKSAYGKKEISVDVTGIIQDWQKEELSNNGIVLKLSQDDLENKSTALSFDEKTVKLKILYSFEYK